MPSRQEDCSWPAFRNTFCCGDVSIRPDGFPVSLTALRSVGALNVLHEYACARLGRDALSERCLRRLATNACEKCRLAGEPAHHHDADSRSKLPGWVHPGYEGSPTSYLRHYVDSLESPRLCRKRSFLILYLLEGIRRIIRDTHQFNWRLWVS